MHAVRQYVGQHYGDHGSREARPVNFMEMAVNIYMFNMSARAPRVNVSTRYPQLKPVASGLTLGLNEFLTRINAEQIMQDFVLDALFSMGIMKVGIASDDFANVDGDEIGVGSPYMSTVGLDDFVYDTDARHYDDVRFAGNKYLIRKNVALESGMYDEKLVEEYCSLLEARPHNEDGGERASQLTSGASYDDDVDNPLLELFDIWLPDENMVVTFPAEQGQTLLLRETEYEGPPTGARSQQGPYHLLRFNHVPDNIYPSPPVNIWRDMDDLANKLMNKMGRQAARQKDITVVPRGREADGDTIQKAADGWIVGLDDPGSINNLQFGGVDGKTLAFFLQAKDVLSYMAGNLDALGGLSKQADTLGQEQMIAESSAMRIQSMQQQLYNATSQIMRSLAWYVVSDPLMELPYTRRAPGYEEIEIASSIRAEDMQGDFLDYNFTIEPYSMQPQTPQQKLGKVMQLMQEFYLPLQPMMQEQGIGLDFNELNKLIADYAALPELESIVTAVDQPPEEPTESRSRMPNNTTRRYIREGRSGANRHNRDDTMSRLLMGEAVQDDEMSRIGGG